MAMGSGGNRRGSVLSEINVTPLVDVMLVLLIVFMVTTPIIVEDMRQRQVDIDLPTTDAKPVTPDSMQTLLILHDDMRVGLDTGGGAVGGAEGEKTESELAKCTGEKVFDTCLKDLSTKLAANPKLKDGRRIYIMADRNLPYGFVVDVMARVKKAGIVNLGMVTNPPPTGAPG